MRLLSTSVFVCLAGCPIGEAIAVSNTQALGLEVTRAYVAGDTLELRYRSVATGGGFYQLFVEGPTQVIGPYRYERDRPSKLLIVVDHGTPRGWQISADVCQRMMKCADRLADDSYQSELRILFGDEQACRMGPLSRKHREHIPGAAPPEDTLGIRDFLSDLNAPRNLIVISSRPPVWLPRESAEWIDTWAVRHSSPDDTDERDRRRKWGHALQDEVERGSLDAFQRLLLLGRVTVYASEPPDCRNAASADNLTCHVWLALTKTKRVAATDDCSFSVTGATGTHETEKKLAIPLDRFEPAEAHADLRLVARPLGVGEAVSAAIPLFHDPRFSRGRTRARRMLIGFYLVGLFAVFVALGVAYTECFARPGKAGEELRRLLVTAAGILIAGAITVPRSGDIVTLSARWSLLAAPGLALLVSVVLSLAKTAFESPQQDEARR